MFVTALGLYEVELNGQRVGDQVLSPGWTDYRKRVCYQEFDVTKLVQEGNNALGAILGDGWYCGYVGWQERQFYGDRPKLLLRLEVALTDGTTLEVLSDGSWSTTTGPILESDLMSGEMYDARRELGLWSSPNYDSSGWQPVLTASVGDIQLVTSAAPPVRHIEKLTPTLMTESANAATRIFDLGQNLSGRVEIKVKAEAGRTVRLRYAEVLDPKGRLYIENLRAARATDYYTCKGGEDETWEPRFTFHGFRYIEVSGIKDTDLIEVTGIVLHSDMPITGSFSCSHPKLNQLQKNILWGQRGNFLDIPTDCPQRDERLGWTGDAQVFCRTAAFNMDVQGFFHKWIQDLRDAQSDNGGIPMTAPSLQGGESGPAWSDAHVICPWTIYLCYGDKQILSENYESMVRYVDFLAKGRSKDLIRSHPELDTWQGFGDWLALDGSGINEGGTPKDLIGTAFLAYDAAIMTRIATILGHAADALKYEELRKQVVLAFQRRFVTPEGLLASGTQTAYVLALHFELLPNAVRATAAAELARDIKRRGYHLATGFVGTPYLLEVLETHGYLDVAYRLLEQETFPSWLFPVNNGATTIWERWDGWTPEKGFQDAGMNSFNHYAYGAVGAWMYRSVAGLELDPEEPGYQRVIFRPRPGGSITSATASLQTKRGLVSISWELKGSALHLELGVPTGAHASFLPPEGFGTEVQKFSAGVHRVVLGG